MFVASSKSFVYSDLKAEDYSAEFLPRDILPGFTKLSLVTNHALLLSELTKSNLKTVTSCPTRIMRVAHHVLPTQGFDRPLRLIIRFYSFLSSFGCDVRSIQFAC